MRKLPRQQQSLARFQRDGLTGRDCENKCLLVVGVGHIGLIASRLGRAMGMQVLGVDIDARQSEVIYVSIAEGLPRADVILSAMNLTDQNRGYFNYQLLKAARPDAIFVNIARGELSPSVELLRLLDENRLGGVALDVYADESELAGSLRSGQSSGSQEVRAVLELSSRPNVILTPHNAFNTCESVEKKSSDTLRQIQQFLTSGDFLWSLPQEQA